MVHITHSDRRLATPCLALANTAGIHAMAEFLNSNSAAPSLAPTAAPAVAAVAPVDASDSAATLPASARATVSLIGQLRSLLREELLREGDEETLCSLAEDVQATIAMSLTSELYAPRQPLRRAPPTHSCALGAANLPTPLQEHSAGMLRAVSIAVGMFRVPTEFLWRPTELECVLCGERFDGVSRNTFTKRGRSSAATRIGTTAAAAASENDNMRWCRYVVDHALRVHMRRGVKNLSHNDADTPQGGAHSGASTKQRQKRRRADSDGTTDRSLPATKLPSDADHLAFIPVAPNGALQPHDAGGGWLVPLRTLHHFVKTKCITAATGAVEQRQNGQVSTTSSSSRAHHQASRQMAIMTDIVFREALLCPCASAAWLREDD